MVTRGTNTARGLHVGDRFLHSSGRHYDLTGPRNAACPILGIKQHTTCTQKIKSFGIAPLVERPVRTFNPSTPSLDNQSERGHATTADAEKSNLSVVGHWRNLEGLPIRGATPAGRLDEQTEVQDRRSRAGFAHVSGSR